MSQDQPTLLHRAALWYAEHNFPVFPCKPAGKTPIVPTGFKAATTDIAQINTWWTRTPDANVAMPTGKASGRIVIDVDPRNGGLETFQGLIHKHGALPSNAPQQITGRHDGGTHTFLREPGVPLPKTLGPGVDLQATGAYVVMAPSVHPDTGKRYEWDGIEGKKALLTTPECPAWIIKLAHAKPAGDGPDGPPVPPGKIKKGSQHRTLFKLGCAMRAQGAGEEEIFNALWLANQNRCEQPDATPEKMHKLAASICGRYPAGGAPAEETLHVAADAFPPSLDLLNSMTLFHGRIKFSAVSRRGSMILATTAEEQQIIWPTMTDLTSFARARAAIADGADVLLPQPPKNQVTRIWDPIAALLIQLSARDAIRVEHVLKAECKDLLILMWRYAKQPHAKDNQEFIKYMTEISKSERGKKLPDEHPAGPAAGLPCHAPPCVFTAEEHCWVHVPTFRNWISMPALTNRLYPLADIRQGLLLLGFAYQKDVTRGAAGQSESVSLWRGPVDVLIE